MYNYKKLNKGFQRAKKKAAFYKSKKKFTKYYQYLLQAFKYCKQLLDMSEIRRDESLYSKLSREHLKLSSKITTYSKEKNKKLRILLYLFLSSVGVYLFWPLLPFLSTFFFSFVAKNNDLNNTYGQSNENNLLCPDYFDKNSFIKEAIMLQMNDLVNSEELIEPISVLIHQDDAMEKIYRSLVAAKCIGFEINFDVKSKSEFGKYWYEYDKSGMQFTGAVYSLKNPQVDDSYQRNYTHVSFVKSIFGKNSDVFFSNRYKMQILKHETIHVFDRIKNMLKVDPELIGSYPQKDPYFPAFPVLTKQQLNDRLNVSVVFLKKLQSIAQLCIADYVKCKKIIKEFSSQQEKISPTENILRPIEFFLNEQILPKEHKVYGDREVGFVQNYPYLKGEDFLLRGVKITDRNWYAYIVPKNILQAFLISIYNFDSKMRGNFMHADKYTNYKTEFVLNEVLPHAIEYFHPKVIKMVDTKFYNFWQEHCEEGAKAIKDATKKYNEKQELKNSPNSGNQAK